MQQHQQTHQQIFSIAQIVWDRDVIHIVQKEITNQFDTTTYDAKGSFVANRNSLVSYITMFGSITVCHEPLLNLNPDKKVITLTITVDYKTNNRFWVCLAACCTFPPLLPIMLWQHTKQKRAGYDAVASVIKNIESELIKTGVQQKND